MFSSAKNASLFVALLAFATLQAGHAYAGALSGIGSVLSGIGGSVTGAINGAISTIGGVFGSIGLGGVFNDIIKWLFGTGACGQQIDQGIGEVLCNVVVSSEMLPGLISAIAYGAGLVLSVTALLKLKDHVINPDRTPVSDSMKRFVAGGALFSLPTISRAVRNLLVSDGAVASYEQTSGFSGSVSTSGGLDGMVTMLVADIWQPLQILLSSFSYLAGLVFVVIGISRLIKTAQDGPRGPSGIGTIMTFVTAGVLFSLDNLMGAFSGSMFATNDVATYAILNNSTGDTTVDSHVEGVISAVTAFMALVGWISFIRGFFILREVAEGNGQASLMAATTHMFGGALAVNLGPLINAVQNTFGLTAYGVSFT